MHVKRMLTHCLLVLRICISESGQHCFRLWLVAYSAPSHFQNQCWVIVNWSLRNKLRENFNQNTKPFIHEHASENIICEKSATLLRENELISNQTLFVLFVAEQSLMWIYHVEHHGNIAISLSWAQFFLHFFLTSYQISMFTQVWRCIHTFNNVAQ